MKQYLSFVYVYNLPKRSVVDMITWNSFSGPKHFSHETIRRTAQAKNSPKRQ